MSTLTSQFLMSLLSSSLVMKYNLNWHRKLILLFIPLFILFTFLQTEYLLKRVEIKQTRETKK